MKSRALRAVFMPAGGRFLLKNSHLMGFLAGLFASSVQAGTVQVTVVDRDGKPAQDAVVVLQHATARNAASSLPTMATVANEKMQFIHVLSYINLKCIIYKELGCFIIYWYLNTYLSTVVYSKEKL
ncbi:MAG: hypothetical protein HC765_06370 [Brachymonas sp.]|nr:hypothetical protein [Brachymonas sp.]